MQSKYIVNAEPDEGERCEVHTQWCKHLPDESRQILLGHFEDYKEAIVRAKTLGLHAGPCQHCCLELHVSDFLG